MKKITILSFTLLAGILGNAFADEHKFFAGFNLNLQSNKYSDQNQQFTIDNKQVFVSSNNNGTLEQGIDAITSTIARQRSQIGLIFGGSVIGGYKFISNKLALITEANIDFLANNNYKDSYFEIKNSINFGINQKIGYKISDKYLLYIMGGVSLNRYTANSNTSITENGIKNIEGYAEATNFKALLPNKKSSTLITSIGIGVENKISENAVIFTEFVYNISKYQNVELDIATFDIEGSKKTLKAKSKYRYNSFASKVGFRYYF
jgi:hypothetical protein